MCIYFKTSKGLTKKRARRLIKEHGLTARELRVAAYCGMGMTNGEIAEFIHLSVYTVAKELESIREKIGGRNKQDVTRFACNNNIVQ